MHSTHEVNCKICGKKLAFWSGFGDNMQFANEYECQGSVMIPRKNTWRLGMHTYHGFKPTKAQIKNDIKEQKGNVELIRVTEESTSCYVQHDTYFCENCAENLKYKCSTCGGKIKLTRKI